MQANGARRRRGVELGVLGLLAAAVLLIAAAVWGAYSALPRSVTGTLAGAALVLAAAAMFASREFKVFEQILPDRAQPRRAQLRRWTGLKITSVLLFLLLVVNLLTLIAAMAVRMERLEPPGSSAIQTRFVWALMGALSVTLLSGLYLCLRVPLERRPGHQGLYATVGIGAGASLAILGALVSGTPTQLGPLHPADGVFLQLAGAGLLCLSLFPLRGLPTAYRIFMHDPTQVAGPIHYTKSQGVFLPVLVAIGLLFLLSFLFAVFGLGILQDVDRVTQNLWVTVLLLLFFMGMGASFFVSLWLARREDRPALHTRVRSRDAQREAWILGASVAAASILAAAALMVALGVSILSLASHRWVDLAVVALLVALGPIGFYKAFQMRRIRRMEDRFPDLLRDLSSSHKGGLTLAASVHVAAKGDYGALTPAIRRMSDELSWNLGFEEVFDRFGKSVHTPIVQRSVSLVLEASHSGGSTVDVLEAASRDAREIKSLENKRRLNMNLYLAVIYLTFLVFLGVISVLYARFMPEIIDAAFSMRSSGATGVAGLGTAAPELTQFRTLYYLAAVVQGVGNGVIAGIMTTGRALHGMRHAFAMVLISFLAFSVWML